MNGRLDIGDISPGKLFIAISAVLGILFALVAESVQPLFMQIIQWQLQTTGAVILILACHRALFSISLTVGLNPWFKLLLSGLIGALLFAPVALLSDIYLGGEEDAYFNLSGLLNEFFAIAPPICIAWIAMNAPWNMGYQLKSGSIENIQADNAHLEVPQIDMSKPETSLDNKPPDAEKPSSTHPDFMQLTNIKDAREIEYMKAELHYIAVVSNSSKQLILYSLKQAAEQLEEAHIPGIQCHRSYWVARHAISDFQRQGRQATILLKSGEAVPVSRSRVKAIEHSLSEPNV